MGIELVGHAFANHAFAVGIELDDDGAGRDDFAHTKTFNVSISLFWLRRGQITTKAP
jgi:hypothetical protein